MGIAARLGVCLAILASLVTALAVAQSTETDHATARASEAIGARDRERLREESRDTQLAHARREAPFDLVWGIER